MLSNKLEKNLVKLFHEISRGESSIESCRRMLTNNYDFDSYQIFNYLDHESKNRIDSIDLINYLSSKNIPINNLEAQLIILFYDQSFNGVLNYEEFKFFILNENAFSNKSSSNNFLGEINKDIDESLLNLLKNELKLIKNCILILNELQKDENFDVHMIYHKLKGFNGITEKSLGIFLSEKFEIFSDNDLKMIKRRLDLNKDGIIDLNDLITFLKYPKCSLDCEDNFCKECLNELYYFSNNKAKNDLIQDQIINNENNNEEENLFLNKYNCNFDYQQNEEEFNKINEKLNFSKNYIIKDFSNKENININSDDKLKIKIENIELEKFYEKMKREEDKEFLNYLKEVMLSEKNKEKYKLELSLNTDFNCQNAFNIFQSAPNNNFLTKDDLKYGLNLLNLYPTNKELNILINKYSYKKDNNLHFLDFFDMVAPYENNYRKIIQHRQPNINNILRSPMVFTYKTGNDLKKLFNRIIKEENKLNEMRKVLSGDLINKLDKYVNNINITKNNYFDEHDLLLYLKKKGIFIDDDSCCLLFIRLDSNRDGKVNSEELKEEFKYIF